MGFSFSRQPAPHTFKRSVKQPPYKKRPETMTRQSSQLDPKELARYARHLSIPEFGMQAQEKLKDARVLVVGTGGLGSPALQYLAAAGVGTIGIIDFDVVDESNLQRQVLFTTSDVGRKKTEVARERLQDLNPYVTIQTHEVRLTSENAMDIINGYDIVADGTDNFATRYLVNDACVFAGVPNVYGSIFQFEGQVSVFNHTDPETGETGPNYRDLFPTPPPPGLVPNCAEAGVLGVLPGIIGSMQANEVIKLAAGIGTPMSGRLLLFDALHFEPRTMKVSKDENNPLTGSRPTQTGLIDYEQFCGTGDEDEPQAHQEPAEITVQEFKQWLDHGEDVQIVDVREPHEYEICNLGGDLIPLGEVEQRADEIARDRKVVVHCKAGSRSADAIRKLQQTHGLTNLYNLQGGITKWAKQVDPEVPVY